MNEGSFSIGMSGTILESACKTHVGKQMADNFDSVILDDEKQIYVIADGLSTMPGGDIASQAVTTAIADFYRSLQLDNVSKDQITQILEQSIEITNNAVLNIMDEHPTIAAMGTTLVYCLIVKEMVYVCSVGDSRVYLITPNDINVKTKDHTVFELLHENKIGPLQVLKEVNEDRVLTQFIGQPDSPVPYISNYHFPKGSYLLVCTDGLTDMITPDEIHDVVINGFGGLQEKCNCLVDMAIEFGGYDNVTVALVYNHK